MTTADGRVALHDQRHPAILEAARAFVVRMLIIPAAMHLLGESAWWLPTWLDRILPDVDVEGAKLERSHPVADS